MKYTFLAFLAVIATFLLPAIPAVAQDDVQRKAVLVTGASSGIGLRIAETLSQNGFYVYAGARKEADLERLNALENVSSVRLDVTIQEDIDNAVTFVKDQGRGLWGIINNAGVVRYAPLVSGPESEFRFTFDVNVLGPYKINQAFLPLIIESKGRTAIIGSINGFIPAAADAGYAASKFAVEGYTDSLVLELADTGVHVAIVEPGAFRSRIRETMLEQALAAADDGNLELSDDEREGLANAAAGNADLAEPDAVADAALHLMSSNSPKTRYMVTPNREQAEITIQYAMQRLLQLNQDQPYSYDREQLIAVLDELLAASAEAN